MARRHDRDPDENVTTPFPMAPVSNGEWVPHGFTPRQRAAEKVVAEEAERIAKRHNMTRAQFLRTAAGTMLGFSVLNRIYGLDAWGDNAVLPVRKVECEDLDAARERLTMDPYFILDVQTHHVDTKFPVFKNNPGLFCLRFCREVGDPICRVDENGIEVLGQNNYIREMFLDSETHVAVMSGLPSGTPCGPEAMAETRDLANQLAGSERCLTQAVIDPNIDNATIPYFPPTPEGQKTRIESMEHQVRDLGARAVKTYTYNGNYRLDDEAIAYPMYEEMQRLGLSLLNCHKGLPAQFAVGSAESVRTIDLPKAVRDWPTLKFCAYHSGYFEQIDDTSNPLRHPLGKFGITEFIEVVQGMPKKDRKRVYAEIGSTFAITLIQDGGATCGNGPPPTGPLNAAHFIGQLLKTLGPKNILWGTDSIWWGSPQWLIDAFKVLQIPAELQQQFGYPALGKKEKKLIFGLNAAKLYGVKKKARKNLCSIPEDAVGSPSGAFVDPDDRIAALQRAVGGPYATRRLHVYGPQTRRDFIKRFGWKYG
ncbi:MAG TPA: amidohydrolase family protein [Candidatus Limnocylindria bacterium]|nr:amidohydrolase family protein [Candidatus Limnocylindria bacterium]